MLLQQLYTLLFYLMQPIIWLRLLYRSIKTPAYRYRWHERYGFCQGKIKPQGIIVHTVSVGETLAAVRLIKTLQQRYPQLPITVTTMTPTGSERVKACFGDSVSHVYLPYDLPCALRRFIKICQPKLVIIMETELWPNLIQQLHKKQIPLLIANARLSDRSTLGYQRFKKTISRLLGQISMVAAQNPHSATNFLSLGLPASQLSVTGSIKFDITISAELTNKISMLKTQWALDRQVWIAASTHPGEDEIILTTYQQLLEKHPSLLLILVPRHSERFRAVENLLITYQLNYICYSKHQTPTAITNVILGDTMGELLLFYAMADIAFVGGSLIKRGGHNPLEAAFHHLPILMGEHVFNFPVICQQLVEKGALTFVTQKTLKIELDNLLANQLLCQQMGELAYAVLQENQGALERLLQLVDNLLIK